VSFAGVGGLGHQAVQFAAKMGCEVVVSSGTDSKKEEAMKLGAKEFYATKGLEDLTKLGCEPINRLLVTTSKLPDFAMYFPILAPEACIFPLGVSQGTLEVPYMPLLLSGIRSLVAPRVMHERMLRSAATHGIEPITESSQ